jgi:transcription initiation factor IIE alpha subunit
MYCENCAWSSKENEAHGDYDPVERFFRDALRVGPECPECGEKLSVLTYSDKERWKAENIVEGVESEIGR